MNDYCSGKVSVAVQCKEHGVELAGLIAVHLHCSLTQEKENYAYMLSKTCT